MIAIEHYIMTILYDYLSVCYLLLVHLSILLLGVFLLEKQEREISRRFLI